MLFYFFFNDTATTEIYTLSLHDALPISCSTVCQIRGSKHCRSKNAATAISFAAFRTAGSVPPVSPARRARSSAGKSDRKSTRLNSSHANISYAVFCLKKKKKNTVSDDVH